jgi:hypothetical protein
MAFSRLSVSAVDGTGELGLKRELISNKEEKI